jgi:Undecaprenyl-phosphate galactose phosphotransferase WbaP
MVDIDLTHVDTTDEVSSLQHEIAADPRAHEVEFGSPQHAGIGYLLQQLKTSLPKIIADLAVLAFVHLVVWIIGWDPQSIVLLSSFSVVLMFAYWATNQYPGIGVHAAIALRQSTCTIAVVACGMLVFTIVSGTATIGFLIQWSAVWIGIAILIPLMRFFATAICRNFDWWAQPVVILGSDFAAGSVFRAMDANRRSGLRPLGIVVDPYSQWEETNIDPSWVLGTIDDLASIKQRHDVYWVVNANTRDSGDAGNYQLASRAARLFPLRLSPTTNQETRVSVWDSFVCLDRYTLLKQTDRLMLPLHRLAKRTSDILLASVLVILLMPIYLALALTIRLTSRGAIFYNSARVGSNGDEFLMTKFRSMYLNGDEILAKYLDENPEKARLYEQNVKLENDPRVTPVGKLMRRTSLDELPQIFDVLRGKMSLVGPRPMLPDERPKYGEMIDQYSRVLPGITGLWQVSGRNNTSYEQRLHYVNFYVQNWSPWLDLCILAKTVLVVTKKEGAY